VIKGPGVFARWALGSTVLSSIYIALTSFIAKVIAAKFHSLAVTEVAGPTLFIA
jgi:hypothetical protein